MTTSKTNATRKVAMVAAGGLALFGLFRLGGWMLSDDAETAGTEHLVNQIWIDHFPEDNRDIVGHLALVDHPEGKGGITGRSSMWRHRLEVFLWAREDDTVFMHFPQSQTRGKVKARTWECKGEAPEPFELCLELRAGERTLKMYSREEWIIKPTEVESSLDAITAEVPALSHSFDGAWMAQVGEAVDEPVDTDADVPNLTDPAQLID